MYGHYVYNIIIIVTGYDIMDIVIMHDMYSKANEARYH